MFHFEWPSSPALTHVLENKSGALELVIAVKRQITDHLLYLNICDKHEFCSTPGIRVTFLFFLQIKCCMFQPPIPQNWQDI